MSEHQNNNGTGKGPSENNETQKTRPKHKLPGRLLAWGKENNNYLFLFATFVVFVALLLAPSLKPHPDNPPYILNFVSASYILLIIGLVLLWFSWVLPNHDENTNPESRMKILLYGILGILGMLTILGIVSLIVWAITQSGGPPDYWGEMRRQ